ncbi:hypothetical protein HXX76_005391 [Chlamydomonas incerta]|uniref:Uncharacterized protein n=1 Tax=Chlamydomonas incerta TaxID=51695 RepID=A0A835W7U9_CHLIN|nr:hypothetical protein HXX76_005391 [Chlamydomonas incerta]|eukprot:KAG2438851.1 hypothetical protein HXX76_005391 [Chlamydomonas incerta]
MAKKKQADAGSPAKIRRPSGYWAVFNAWWRDHFDRTGCRPTVDEMTSWYKANAMTVWGPVNAPPLEDLKQLSKGMRSTAHVRDYFKKYRAQKRMAKGGDSPVRRVHSGRVAKAAGGAKPRRGRRAGSDSSDEDDADYGVESETEDMGDEGMDELASDEAAEVGAGELQPQPSQQQAAFLPHLLGSSTSVQPGPHVTAAAAFIAAAARAAALARAEYATGNGFGSQSSYGSGAQGFEHEQLCYTPRPEMEDAGASLAQQGSWQPSMQTAAATTVLDPAGSGFTHPPAAHTASRAPSPPAAKSPPTPTFTGAAAPAPQDVSPSRHGPRSMEGAGCTSDFSAPQLLQPPQQQPAATTSSAPTGPACDGAAAPPLPRYLLGGRFQTTAGSAPLPSHGSVPLPPLPAHAAQHSQLQQAQGPAASELPGGASRAHSLPCAAFPSAPGPQRYTAPSGSLNDASAAPPPAPWQYHHPQQYPHPHVPYPHHPPPHGSAGAPAPYRYGPAGYPPHPAYPHGYHPAYAGYGYPPYGMPPPPYGYPPPPYGRYGASASAPPPPYAPPHHPYHHGHGMPPAYPHSAGPQYPHSQPPAAATTTAPPHPHASGPDGALELGHSLMLPRTSEGASLSWLPSLHDDIDLDAVLEAEMGAGADSVAFLDMPQQHHHHQPQQQQMCPVAAAPSSQQPQQQTTRPSEGGQTDAFAELWMRWEAGKGADGEPAMRKDGATAAVPGMQQQRPCVQVHVFQE